MIERMKLKEPLAPGQELSAHPASVAHGDHPTGGAARMDPLTSWPSVKTPVENVVEFDNPVRGSTLKEGII
jgi:hypothetical protein